MRAASYLINFLEKNSFYAQANMRNHVVCCAMTHEHQGKIATFSLMCSPLSDEADFETTLASSLVVAGHREEMLKKSGTLGSDFFWDVSV